MFVSIYGLENSGVVYWNNTPVSRVSYEHIIM